MKRALVALGAVVHVVLVLNLARLLALRPGAVPLEMSPQESIAYLGWLVGFPLVLAVLLLAARGDAARPAAAPAADAPGDAGLRLLAALQEEGRFVDFLEEDLSAYSDQQIGAAARGIHAGCQKALRARVALEPVLGGTEGEAVVVEAGFDPAAVRLTGNVSGEPPFRGVLRHPGWRATRATLPVRRGQDPRVIAPAEVEIA